MPLEFITSGFVIIYLILTLCNFILSDEIVINIWFIKSGDPLSAGVSIHCLNAIGGKLFFLF